MASIYRKDYKTLQKWDAKLWIVTISLLMWNNKKNILCVELTQMTKLYAHIKKKCSKFIFITQEWLEEKNRVQNLIS